MARQLPAARLRPGRARASHWRPSVSRQPPSTACSRCRSRDRCSGSRNEPVWRCWPARRLPHGHRGRPNPPELRTMDRSYTGAHVYVFRVHPPGAAASSPKWRSQRPPVHFVVVPHHPTSKRSRVHEAWCRVVLALTQAATRRSIARESAGISIRDGTSASSTGGAPAHSPQGTGTSVPVPSSR